MNERRVVVTGMGVVAPNGIGVDAFWDALINGISGIGKITQFDASPFPSRIAGEIKDFDASDYMDAKSVRRTAKFAHFAVASAGMAVADARMEKQVMSNGETGIYIGSVTGGTDVFEKEHVSLREKGIHRMSPFGSAAYCHNSAATEVSIQLGWKGDVTTISSGCTCGLDAIGAAWHDMQMGKIDVAIAGGSDGSVTPLTLGSLCATGIVSTRNNEPAKASRPFDARRDGGVVSEGAAIVVLEEMEHALGRNAFIYGEIMGYSKSTEASNMFETDVRGIGFVREMKKVLAQASLESAEVDYVCAHGPSDVIRDRAETYAIKEVFDGYTYKVPVSSIKSMIGDPLASAGPMQLIASLMTMRDRIIPPTINYEFPDPECDLDYVPNKARRNNVRTVLINSYGFGGSNSSLIVSNLNGAWK
jgi:3-oxoacyl-[acyl-carrier-protein] synthase II